MSVDIHDELVHLLPRLRRFALTLTRSSSNADDLVQSAIERALGARRQWEAGTRLDSWVFRIMQNLWIDETRGAGRRPRLIELEADWEGEDGRRTVGVRAELRRVSEAFSELPLDQQEVMALVVIEGASYKDAARILGIPTGTVMSRISRARAHINARIGDLDV